MIKKNWKDKLFDICNTMFMVLLMIVMVYPLWHALMASLSDSNKLLAHEGLLLWPQKFTVAAYKMVAKNPNIITGYANTIFVVVIGTILSTFVTALGAYCMSRKPFPHKRLIMFMMLFTMYFSGGMIPRYLLINNTLGLGNTIWVLILPNLVTTYNLVVMRTGFEAIPDSLVESAQIDGASHFRILFRIIIPVALPSMAVVILFYAVSYWNAWFDACIFINEREKFPLQVILREILLQNSTESMSGGESGDKAAIAESIRYATIMVATVPVLVIYPFVQKYFVKGAMVGAVKG